MLRAHIDMANASPRSGMALESLPENGRGLAALDLSGYAFKPVRDDGEFLVARGSSPAGDRTSVLVVTPTESSLQGRTTLECAYALRDALEPEWAARPLALVHDDGRMRLVLEDPEGEFLDHLLVRPFGLAQALRVGAGIALALRRFHARDLVHRDIRPANILVNLAAGEIRLTGFGQSTRMQRQQPMKAPETITGTPAYMAPEQTGRINRTVDQRSDLYSLGVTLYEMVTGVLPFTAADPVEWSHCHVARRPVPPREHRPDLPEIVSMLVLTLLAKNAEDRYQTAAGVEADLRRILAHWETRGRVDAFVLGSCDTASRLLISGNLYGRTSAIETLLAAFNRVVASGAPEFVLVSGYSGIGKSSVVNELRKAVVPKRGMFAAGKFDRQKRNIPYATLAQAFESVVGPILALNETELSRWRERIREAVGENGRLVINLVPELELVIGPQPAVPSLPPREERNRFHGVLQKFIGAFARAEHPLVLFIDDLQWLDAATLDLVEELMARSDVRHLMVIGAFRGNEVTAEHPLARMLKAVRGDETRVHDIVLSPLHPADLQKFVADTLRCPPDQAEPLAQLIYEKTRGNPFFTIQFITSLAEEALLKFDPAAVVWKWNLASIQAKGYTDNVVDLVAGKINRLSVETREALRQLACLGNRAETETLAVIGGDTETARHAVLAEALEAGLILRLDDAYAFAHDRIQEAAYELIPASDRAATHLKIGRSLEAHPSSARRDELIFDMVNQFNRAGPLVTDSSERIRIAELNWNAGRRAKVATGFESALAYFVAAEMFMPEDAWSRHYTLAFETACDRAECEFVMGHVEAANEQLERLARRTANRLDLARVTGLLTAVYTTTDRLDRAIATNLDYLRHFGINWSASPSHEEMSGEYQRMGALMDGRSIEALIDLPLMDDPEWRAVVDALLTIQPAARFSRSNLYVLATISIVNLSLQHGNCDGSCVGYVELACILGPFFGDPRSGYRFGQLALDLVEQRGLRRFKAKVFTVVGHHVWPRTRPMRDALKLIRRAFDAAQENGDFTFLAFSFAHVTTHRLVLGDPLAEVQEEAERGLALMLKGRYRMLADCFALHIRLIWSLRGITPDFTSFGEAFADERAYERHLQSDPALWVAWRFYLFRKIQACYYAGEFVTALESSAKAQPLSLQAATFVERAEFHFYDALTHAAAFDSASPEKQRQFLDVVTAHHGKLAEWQETSPENFNSRAALLAAELARMEARDLAAMQFYEEAIQAAEKNGFVNEEALASELAGRFHLARGLEISGNAHLRRARVCYQRWGAEGKVRQLDRLYPRLRRSSLPGVSAGNPSLDQMDLAVVLKASQAISSEIVLDRLIEALLQIALEHAGADKGTLILQDRAEWKIAAEAVTDAGRIRLVLRQAPATQNDLPAAIVRYALRTKEIVIVDDASAQNPYMEDEYILARKPKSVLCLPLFKQTALVGALYLENSLTSHVFTKDRVAVLKLLASQAAISLENARLYSNLQETQTRMDHAERLSLTGSWSWHIATAEIYWSDETYRIWECERPVKPTFDFVRTRVHPDDLDFFRQVTEEGIRDGRNSEFELRLVMPDGALKHIHVARHPLQDDAGQLVGFVGAVRDVTALKKAEDARQKALAELAHVARVATLGELTASIAHELNQPLAGVVTNASASLRWLAGDAPNFEEARDAIRRIIRDGNRAGDVISRLRALFKKTGTVREPVGLVELIDDVVALTKSEVRRHGVILRTEFAGELRSVYADRVQLQQVVFNLVLNATEAMSGVEDRPRELLLRMQNHGDNLVLVAVRDAGSGLDPQHRDRIFDAFYTTKAGGMGMGLSISRSIIENHGGRLWVEGNDGPGATFFFTVASGT